MVSYDRHGGLKNVNRIAFDFDDSNVSFAGCPSPLGARQLRLNTEGRKMKPTLRDRLMADQQFIDYVLGEMKQPRVSRLIRIFRVSRKDMLHRLERLSFVVNGDYVA